MTLSLKRWEGKVAIVTGASSGIGYAIAEKLVEEGIIVVGLARRSEKIEELSKKLAGKRGKLYSVKVDLSKEDDIINAFKWTIKNAGPVAILINNAGVYLPEATVVTGKTEEWRSTFDTNVLGLSIASREAVKIMRQCNIDGHIINMNSVVGHQVLPFMFNMYPPSKYAVTALTETLRFELNSLKSKIKVTSVSPGAVETSMLKAAEHSTNLQLEAKLNTEDVANAVVYILSTPPHVQIQELTIKPVGEPF